jgi:hypothetical protein
MSLYLASGDLYYFDTINNKYDAEFLRDCIYCIYERTVYYVKDDVLYSTYCYPQDGFHEDPIKIADVHFEVKKLYYHSTDKSIILISQDNKMYMSEYRNHKYSEMVFMGYVSDNHIETCYGWLDGDEYVHTASGQNSTITIADNEMIFTRSEGRMVIPKEEFDLYCDDYRYKLFRYVKLCDNIAIPIDESILPDEVHYNGVSILIVSRGEKYINCNNSDYCFFRTDKDVELYTPNLSPNIKSARKV